MELETVKGYTTSLDLGNGRSLGCYELPSGEKRVGFASASIALGYDKNWLGRLSTNGKELLGFLQHEGWEGSVVVVKFDVSTTRTSARTISLNDFQLLAKYEAMKGNLKAQILLGWKSDTPAAAQRKRGDGRKWTGDEGYIYCFASPEIGCCKIGFSKNPDSRMKHVQTSFPFKLSLLWVIPGSIQDERHLHEALDDLRLEGEWFDLIASTLVDHRLPKDTFNAA
jgi:hypothetical protein